MKSLYTILLFSIFNFQFSISQAQSVRVFSKTGILKGTYSTVTAALATTIDGDSMILSAHTFKESRLKGNYSVVYQGTIAGADTTIIDAMGNGSVFDRCLGKIRDVIVQGGKYIPPPGGSQGMGIYNYDGFLHLTGSTIIRNNYGYGHGGCILYDGIIDENVKIYNNKTDRGVGGVYGGNTLFIKDNVKIYGNYGNFGSAIALMGSNGNAALKKKLDILGNALISNNNCDSNSTIFFGDKGCMVTIENVTIINNKSKNNKAGAIFANLIPSSLPFDSIGVPNISIKNTRIYNPKLDGTRIPEIFLGYNGKPIKFHSEGCWWGNSDTTRLIVAEAGTDFTMPNWAVAKWYGLPFGTSGSQVRAQMQLNTGAALPPNCFKGLEGKFTATAGSFPSPTTVINAGNLIASDYYYPASGPFAITASVDADTFRTNNKGALGIKEPGYTSVKVFPNPATDELHISNLPAGITLHIFDASGRIVLQRGYLDAQPELVIPVADWPAGVYTINLYNQQDQLGTARFVKR
jgi:hypothetical protein